MSSLAAFRVIVVMAKNREDDDEPIVELIFTASESESEFDANYEVLHRIEPELTDQERMVLACIHHTGEGLFLDSLREVVLRPGKVRSGSPYRGENTHFRDRIKHLNQLFPRAYFGLRNKLMSAVQTIQTQG